MHRFPQGCCYLKIWFNINQNIVKYEWIYGNLYFCKTYTFCNKITSYIWITVTISLLPYSSPINTSFPLKATPYLRIFSFKIPFAVNAALSFSLHSSYLPGKPLITESQNPRWCLPPRRSLLPSRTSPYRRLPPFSCSARRWHWHILCSGRCHVR